MITSKILGYLIKNPSETLTLTGEFFGENEYKIFYALKNRQLNNLEITIDLLAKDAKVMSERIMTYVAEGSIKKSTFLELLSEENEKLEIRKIEDIFSLAKQCEEMSIKEKSSFYQSLKEKLNSVSLTKRKYQIYENPEYLDEWYQNYDISHPIKISTGIGKLDEAIGGIGETDFVLVIGDTNVGKTNLVLNMTINALRTGKRILYYSLEMGRGQIADRLISMAGGHQAFRVRERSIGKEELIGTVKECSKYDLRIVDTGTVSSTDVVNDIINEKSRRPIDLVVVDYLQRLDDQKDRQENETQRIAKIARKLKNACINLGVPILTPVQVDKASHKSGKIEVENVADSKVVANEADLALYIYQEEKRSDGLSGNILVSNYIKVVKSRHTAKGQNIPITIDINSLQITDTGYPTIK